MRVFSSHYGRHVFFAGLDSPPFTALKERTNARLKDNSWRLWAVPLHWLCGSGLAAPADQRQSKHLRKSFYWPLEARTALAQYLRSKGWIVLECSTEADIDMACDCTPGDVIISIDSDMFIYKNVSIIRLSISRWRFLVYVLPDVLATLGINRTQLTVLDLVSHNDYNSNIHGLGCATNFSIIKGLHGNVASFLTWIKTPLRPYQGVRPGGADSCTTCSSH
ncbi:hypothetical protein BC939DRAFT_318 [Gamsiella multidivaricata]|uniref:uncharacterized protein n=1 Tax=Gamsiella multidivaricata TaxID=101098 RepID=UPI00221E9407|nr:uncharacterized protein BC939DRAFT_318 [Gamsiella multidivaricata]KAI7832532.1 hypothetical protein BC939DRAFT_318 [Gamsiella multidivaricata]